LTPAKHNDMPKMLDKKALKTSPSAAPSDYERMYSGLFRAISEQKLHPGIKLAEEQLCEAFNVSRGVTRQVLQALARNKVVTLEPNRGAFVAKPSPTEAREVFETRKLVEVALAAQVVARIDAAGIARLREHVQKETYAESNNDRSEELRTSHDFHVLLAELFGNSVVYEMIRDLMARSALITAIYERPHADVCSHSCHGDLVDLLEKDKDGFAPAMLKHLEEIEAQLILVEPKRLDVDLKTLFSVAGKHEAKQGDGERHAADKPVDGKVKKPL
jgi:DNA-binding GntR family transcriptional regulator